MALVRLGHESRLDAMTNDPEAAWPLTQTETGYYPSPPTTASAPPPAPMAPYNAHHRYPAPQQPSGTKPMSNGIRLAYLAIILGISVPLTAISADMIGLIGLAVVWVGIIMVSAIVFRGTH